MLGLPRRKDRKTRGFAHVTQGSQFKHHQRRYTCIPVMETGRSHARGNSHGIPWSSADFEGRVCDGRVTRCVMHKIQYPPLGPHLRRLPFCIHHFFILFFSSHERQHRRAFSGLAHVLHVRNVARRLTPSRILEEFVSAFLEEIQ